MVTTKKWVAPVWMFYLAALGVVLLGGCTPPGARALLRGAVLIREGRYPEAIAELKLATQLLPRNGRAWNHLGLAYHRARQSDSAADAYQRALACDPNLAAARFNLGCLDFEQGRFPAAISELTTYTLLRPDSVAGWLQLGVAQMRVEEWPAAARSLDQVRRLDGRNVEMLNDLGVLLARRRRPRDAYLYFSAAVQEQPRYAPALLNLAVLAQHHFRRRAFALEKYRDYLALRPRPANWAAVAEVAAKLALELRPAEASARSVTSNPSPNPSASSLPSTTSRMAATTPASAPSTDRRPSEPAPHPATSKPEPVSPTVTGLPPQSRGPRLEAAPTNLPPHPTVEVVRVSEEPRIKPPGAVARPPTEPAGVKAVTSSVSSAASPPATNALSLTPRIRPEPGRRGFFARLNPLHWFHRRAKPRAETSPAAELAPANTRATNAPVTAAGVASAPAGAPSPAPVPAPAPAQYAYRHPSRPLPGNREEADRDTARGVQAQRDGRLGESVAAYEEAVRADPSSFAAQYDLGLAAYEAGDLPRSLAAYETALAIDPDSGDARYNFALALAKANYPADAAAQLVKLLVAHPAETRAHLALGNLYARILFAPRLAREQYLKVLELEPRHPQAVAIRMWLAANPP